MQSDSRDKQYKDYFISVLLNGKKEFSEDELKVRSKVVGLDCLKPPFVVVTIAPVLSGVDARDIDRLIHEYLEYTKIQIHKLFHSSYCTLNSGYGVVAVISLDSEKKERLDEEFIHLHTKLRTHFSMELFIGIGSIVDSLSLISISAADSIEMLGYKYQYADRGVINFSNTVKFRYNTSVGLDSAFDSVINCFKEGDIGQMSVKLDELVKHIRYRYNVSKTSIRRTFVELTVDILHIASNAGVNVDEVLNGTDPYTWMLSQGHTEIMTEWLLKLSSVLLGRMKEQQEKAESQVIQTACKFIVDNIGNPCLGLSTVSGSVGLSDAYFSQLFKKEKKIGLNSYILDERLKLADGLLVNSTLDISDISIQLGFTSASYFSKVYKKNRGFTPGEKRRKATTCN